VLLHQHQQGLTACMHTTLATLIHRYAIIRQEDGQQVVESEELMEHTLLLHQGLSHGDVIEVLDTWCDRSYPGSILSSSAFTQVCDAPSASLHP
jgi:hypothetical protein